MKTKPRLKKILVAIDGSEQSFTAVRYVSRVFSKKSEVVLFHVSAEVPEAFRDMNVQSLSDVAKYPLQIWKVHQQELIDEFMEKAHTIFVDAGFPREAVSIEAQTLISGIARDILNESHGEYSTLALGRTGLSTVEEITMGSVATKLVEAVNHIPVVLVAKLQ